jgi:hypothetical protein
MFDSDEFDEDLPFEDLIEKYDMFPEVSISVDEEGILVSEKWESNIHEHITAERFYYFDIYFMDYLPDNVKIKALGEILRVYVESELFEEAAFIRDEIMKINK